MPIQCQIAIALAAMGSMIVPNAAMAIDDLDTARLLYASNDFDGAYRSAASVYRARPDSMVAMYVVAISACRVDRLKAEGNSLLRRYLADRRLNPPQRAAALSQLARCQVPLTFGSRGLPRVTGPTGLRPAPKE